MTLLELKGVSYSYSNNTEKKKVLIVIFCNRGTVDNNFYKSYNDYTKCFSQKRRDLVA